jgi:ankyrin repeat protein
MHMPTERQLEQGPKGLKEALLQAEWNNLAQFQKLIQAQRKLVHLKDRNGMTVIHAAANNPFEENHSERLRWLVKDCKVDVNVRDSKGNTALFYAAQRCKVDSVRTLLQLGADASIITNHGLTVLTLLLDLNAQNDFVVSSKQYECARLLFNHGARLGKKDGLFGVAPPWAVDLQRECSALNCCRRAAIVMLGGLLRQSQVVGFNGVDVLRKIAHAIWDTRYLPAWAWSD